MIKHKHIKELLPVHQEFGELDEMMIFGFVKGQCHEIFDVGFFLL